MAPATRLGVAVGAVGLCGLLALTNCAEPTQIILEVFTDACPGSGKPEVIHSTGIAVGTADNIESRRPSSTREGCESATGVGTLVLYPSGAKDDEVAIKVLGGVESTPDRCDPPTYAGCIVHRRMLRFIPNVTQRATVRLTLACLNRQCPTGTTCDNGACVGDRDLLDDGGTSPDAERTESGVVIPLDGGPIDSGKPACAGCKGVCTGTSCEVDCAAVACTGELCAKGLPCNIKCGKTGVCKDIKCTSDAKCTIDCGAQRDSCEKVECTANECDVSCKGDDSCNMGSTITLDAKTKASLTCDGKRACRSAKLSCSAGMTCDLTCKPAGGNANDLPCPTPPGPCATVQANGCNSWNQGNNQ